MGTYICEETPSCTNSQSAICLHCNRRLCIPHITEHNQIVINNIQNLSQEVDVVSKQINDEYEKAREIYHSILTVLNGWRVRQLDKVQQIYESRLQSVESQQETLSITHQQLTESLDRDVRQPLEFIRTDHNTSTLTLNNIQQSMKKIKQHTTQLKWQFPPLSTDNKQPQPTSSSTSSATTAMDVSSSSNNQSANSKKRYSFRLSQVQDINLKRYRPFKRLVDVFSNTSSVEQYKLEIIDYIKKQGTNLPLPILVCSLLTAWHRKSDPLEKNTILREYISMIAKFIPYHVDDYTTLIGIHAFFCNERIEGNKREMMTFLLQYFVNHKCIGQNQIISWYSSKDPNAYKGFDGARQMTAPFIETLWTTHTNTGAQSRGSQTTTGRSRITSLQNN